MAYRGNKRLFQVSFIRVSIMTEMKLIYIVHVAGNLKLFHGVHLYMSHGYILYGVLDILQMLYVLWIWSRKAMIIDGSILLNECYCSVTAT